jgi:LPS-assembly lipoprotein
MWWRKLPERRRPARLAAVARLAVVLAAAGLTAGCWQPLYGTSPTPGGEGVQDKFASVEVPEIKVAKGTPEQRIAVNMQNALQFNLHNGGHAFAPTYQLIVTVVGSQFTAYLDPVSGRPDTQIQSVTANYRLVEIATNKTVVVDIAYAHVDYDIPGPEQRFAGQRARRDAEDHAVEVVAQAIRSRLASYFVAGT